MKYILLFLLLLYARTSTAQQFSSANIPYPESLYAMQEQSLWCWAACNQMLLKAVDIDESQQNQVVKLFGRLINQGAGPNYELARRALAGRYVDNSGKTVRIQPYVSYLSQSNPTDPVVIINHLNNGIPVLMATSMHGYVCVGVDYMHDGSNYQITTLRLLNPANASGIETVTIQQFLSAGLIGFMTFDY